MIGRYFANQKQKHYTPCDSKTSRLRNVGVNSFRELWNLLHCEVRALQFSY